MRIQLCVVRKAERMLTSSQIRVQISSFGVSLKPPLRSSQRVSLYCACLLTTLRVRLGNTTTPKAPGALSPISSESTAQHLSSLSAMGAFARGARLLPATTVARRAYLAVIRRAPGTSGQMLWKYNITIEAMERFLRCATFEWYERHRVPHGGRDDAKRKATENYLRHVG